MKASGIDGLAQRVMAVPVGRILENLMLSLDVASWRIAAKGHEKGAVMFW